MPPVAWQKDLLGTLGFERLATITATTALPSDVLVCSPADYDSLVEHPRCQLGASTRQPRPSSRSNGGGPGAAAEPPRELGEAVLNHIAQHNGCLQEELCLIPDGVSSDDAEQGGAAPDDILQWGRQNTKWPAVIVFPVLSPQRQTRTGQQQGAQQQGGQQAGQQQSGRQQQRGRQQQSGRQQQRGRQQQENRQRQRGQQDSDDDSDGHDDSADGADDEPEDASSDDEPPPTQAEAEQQREQSDAEQQSAGQQRDPPVGGQAQQQAGQQPVHKQHMSLLVLFNAAALGQAVRAASGHKRLQPDGRALLLHLDPHSGDPYPDCKQKQFKCDKHKSCAFKGPHTAAVMYPVLAFLEQVVRKEGKRFRGAGRTSAGRPNLMEAFNLTEAKHQAHLGLYRVPLPPMLPLCVSRQHVPGDDPVCGCQCQATCMVSLHWLAAWLPTQQELDIRTAPDFDYRYCRDFWQVLKLSPVWFPSMYVDLLVRDLQAMAHRIQQQQQPTDYAAVLRNIQSEKCSAGELHYPGPLGHLALLSLMTPYQVAHNYLSGCMWDNQGWQAKDYVEHLKQTCRFREPDHIAAAAGSSAAAAAAGRHRALAELLLADILAFRPRFTVTAVSELVSGTAQLPLVEWEEVSRVSQQPLTARQMLATVVLHKSLRCPPKSLLPAAMLQQEQQQQQQQGGPQQGTQSQQQPVGPQTPAAAAAAAMSRAEAEAEAEAAAAVNPAAAGAAILAAGRLLWCCDMGSDADEADEHEPCPPGRQQQREQYLKRLQDQQQQNRHQAQPCMQQQDQQQPDMAAASVAAAAGDGEGTPPHLHTSHHEGRQLEQCAAEQNTPGHLQPSDDMPHKQQQRQGLLSGAADATTLHSQRRGAVQDAELGRAQLQLQGLQLQNHTPPQHAQQQMAAGHLASPTPGSAGPVVAAATPADRTTGSHAVQVQLFPDGAWPTSNGKKKRQRQQQLAGTIQGQQRQQPDEGTRLKRQHSTQQTDHTSRRDSEVPHMSLTTEAAEITASGRQPIHPLKLPVRDHCATNSVSHVPAAKQEGPDAADGGHARKKKKHHHSRAKRKARPEPASAPTASAAAAPAATVPRATQQMMMAAAATRAVSMLPTALGSAGAPAPAATAAGLLGEHVPPQQCPRTNAVSNRQQAGDRRKGRHRSGGKASRNDIKHVKILSKQHQ